ncbi:MAG: hypothetical protein L6301_00850 [Desulfobacteraceae bacterium]|nr:hypothetical protein [Desulfobacteraceae bacterium]
MILQDLMTKGFLTQDLQEGSKISNFSNFSNFSTFKKSTTNNNNISSSSLFFKDKIIAPAKVAKVAKVDLPAKCPLTTSGLCPTGCRFESRFFRRMINEGVLTMGGPCPVRNVCLLGKKGI